jgi:hypothetical protein
MEHCQLTHNSYIQSVLFNRTIWNKSSAKDWLKNHHLKYNKVDVKPHYLRFRQVEPGCFERFRTKKTENGIDLVIGFTH